MSRFPFLSGWRLFAGLFVVMFFLTVAGTAAGTAMAADAVIGDAVTSEAGTLSASTLSTSPFFAYGSWVTPFLGNRARIIQLSIVFVIVAICLLFKK